MVVVFWACTVIIAAIDSTTIATTILTIVIIIMKITDFLISKKEILTIYQFVIKRQARLSNFQKF